MNNPNNYANLNDKGSDFTVMYMRKCAIVTAYKALRVWGIPTCCPPGRAFTCPIV